MLGFEARTDGTEPNLDGEELSWGAFHTREELRRAVAGGELALPGSVSLARQLIEAWLARGG